MDAIPDHRQIPAVKWQELLAFVCVLVSLEAAYFLDALRPDRALSAADWLLASESFHRPGEPEYEPANRLLTDVACQMEPWMDLAAREWRAGRVALWNPYAGCGAPLLANAQSGVFNPINFIYFLTHSAGAWLAIGMTKIFVAGMGAFLLAGEFGLQRLGRWFTGLVFPFSGFVVVWLQYPMGGVAVWLPMVMWLVERLRHGSGSWWGAWLAIVVAVMLLGGHPETSAHILLVAGVYVLWKSLWPVVCSPADSRARSLVAARRVLTWFLAAVAIGLLVAGAQFVPLAEYLGHSQVWTERSEELPGPTEFRKPDLLAMPALAVPYVFGSYRRGHPHVEKVLGVENFNEIAGGYTGLATIAVLAPLALSVRRRHAWIMFWLVLDLISLAAVYRVPIVDNVVRLIPVLNVTQNQRLLLVVSLAHCLLGGAGLDAWCERSGDGPPRWRWVIAALLVTGSLGLTAAAITVRRVAPTIERRAIEHFEAQARLRDLPPAALRDRADRQVRQVLEFFPRYYLATAGYALALAGLVLVRSAVRRFVPAALLAMTVCDLFLFGRGYNPAIALEQYFPDCTITDFLRSELRRGGRPFRVLSLEEEFPPNVLARYGIADLRNYDAIEVRSMLDFFGRLWPGENGRATSNSWTAWDRVISHLWRLRMANVRFIISLRPPPDDLQGIRPVHQYGRVAVFEIEHASLFSFIPANASEGVRPLPIEATELEYRPASIAASLLVPEPGGTVVLAETHMPGWNVTLDGSPAAPIRVGPFAAITTGPGMHRVSYRYAPASFKIGASMSAVGLAVICLLLACPVVRRWRLRQSLSA